MSQTAIEGQLRLDLGLQDFDPKKHVSIINPMERRAVALRMAIEARVWIDFAKDSTCFQQAERVVLIAKMFDDFIVGNDMVGDDVNS